jgi:hypothetical protein
MERPHEVPNPIKVDESGRLHELSDDEETNEAIGSAKYTKHKSFKNRKNQEGNSDYDTYLLMKNHGFRTDICGSLLLLHGTSPNISKVAMCALVDEDPLRAMILVKLID